MSYSTALWPLNCCQDRGTRRELRLSDSKIMTCHGKFHKRLRPCCCCKALLMAASGPRRGNQTAQPESQSTRTVFRSGRSQPLDWHMRRATCHHYQHHCLLKKKKKDRMHSPSDTVSLHCGGQISRAQKQEGVSDICPTLQERQNKKWP